MRTTAFLIFATLAWITWFVTAMWVQERQQSLALVNADFPLCVTVRPGPMGPPHRIVLAPRNSELS
jgi:hypothetical protein